MKGNTGKNFKVSKSSIYDFDKKNSCKQYWFHKWVLQDIKKEPDTDYQKKGLYFETKAIGSSAYSNEIPNMEFMLLKDGSPNAELRRMDDQVKNFKSMFDPSSEDFLGYTISSVQTYIEDDISRGTIDFEVYDEFDRFFLADLKYTQDVESSFGDFAWGKNPNQMDWTQPILYSDLYYRSKSIKPHGFLVFVFDGKPALGKKMFDLRISDSAKSDIRYKVEYVKEKSLEYLEKGEAPVSPSLDNCESCPIDCPFRFEKGRLDKIKVYV